MKIIAYESARVTVLFPLEEVSPLAGANGSTIVDAIKEKYGFLKGPDVTLPPAEIQKIGLKFENGSPTIDGRTLNIMQFTVFNDGAVIDAQQTEDGETFWDDVVPWLVEAFAFRPFSLPPRRRFLSQMVIEFERPISGLIKQFSDISKSFSQAISLIYENEIKIDFSRIDFGFDNIGRQSSLTVPNFIIERRKGIPFDRERYYCGAPIRTKDHIKILEEIESIVI